MILDRDGHLIHASETARDLLATGNGDPEARWEALRPALAGPLAALVGTGPEERPLELAAGADGRGLRVRLLAPLHLRGGHCIALVEELGRREAFELDLRLASRMRSIGSLYRALAHDLKAPLNALTLNLELLRSSLEEAGPDLERELHEKQTGTVRTLASELARLNRALDSLLAHTVPEARPDGPVELKTLIRELTPLVRPQANAQGVRLEMSFPNEPAVVWGARDGLTQAFLSLAVNALDAMPTGGRLGVRIRREERARAGILVEIEDEGRGLPPDRSRLFKLHFTTKEGGTGLGLAVARAVIEAHGGSLELADNEGPGATARVRLPRSGT